MGQTALAAEQQKHHAAELQEEKELSGQLARLEEDQGQTRKLEMDVRMRLQVRAARACERTSAQVRRWRAQEAQEKAAFQGVLREAEERVVGTFLCFGRNLGAAALV